jgi:hypothetical protein
MKTGKKQAADDFLRLLQPEIQNEVEKKHKMYLTSQRDYDL